MPPRGDDAGIDATMCFTTLETVYNCNNTIVRARHNFPDNWEKVRPEPEELDELHDECQEFWDGLRELEAIDLVASGERYPYEFRPNSEEERGSGHLLFRPIGQETLARAVSTIIRDTTSNLNDATQICKLCAKIDWRLASPPWIGVFFGEGGRMLGSRARQSLGSQLLRYMLGVPWPDTDGLLKDYREIVYPTDPESPEALALALPAIVDAN